MKRPMMKGEVDWADPPDVKLQIQAVRVQVLDLVAVGD